MTVAELYQRLEYILELEPNTIQGTEALEDLEGWDSLAMLSFIAMADADLEMIVPAKALVACKMVTDLVKLLDGKITADSA